MLSPDQQRLVRIWDYCNSIGRSIQRFGSSWESFYADMDYQEVERICNEKLVKYYAR